MPYMQMRQNKGSERPNVSADDVVCACHRITESVIRKAIERRGANSLSALKAVTKAGTRCTGCEVHLFEILDDYASGSGHPGIVGTARRGLTHGVSQWIRSRARSLIRPWTRTAVWVASLPEFRTRIVISNIPFPEDPSGEGLRYRTTLFSADGEQVGETFEGWIESGETLGLDVDSFLPAALVQHHHGLVFVDYFRLRRLGSLRPYCHWYSPRSFTTTHDKFMRRRLAEGFYALTNVRWGPAEDTHVVLVNPGRQPFRSRVRLALHRSNTVFRGRLELPPHGAYFGSARGLLNTTGKDAQRGEGTFWLENTDPLMAYCFGFYRESKIWVAQHF